MTHWKYLENDDDKDENYDRYGSHYSTSLLKLDLSNISSISDAVLHSGPCYRIRLGVISHLCIINP